ncbi:MAG: 50S ribosomal protein L11 methyltransferase [Capnocytophaga sp.]|uniref:50S ribosomal protein L11 methyltransferase n=1 Tax=Capnocytophaga sp. TaxID=44737 RepID=UPI003F9ED369
MNYIEYTFTIAPMGVASEILVAELAEVGFESFVDTETGLQAYIQAPLWHADLLNDIQILNSDEFRISYSYQTIEQVNWNEEWEKHFEPISIDETCTVRATFHPVANTPYEIIIDPKMSFGTGHHETTYMMLQFLLKEELKGKKVLDMGCGTSVLAIMAAKRGATEILAIDVDEWCVENSIENVQRNGCEHIKVQLGDATSLAKEKDFDLIIANINRNILLADLPLYVPALKAGGTLLLSGFYKEDMPLIVAKAEECGLQYVENLERNQWVAVKFRI